MQNRWVLTAEIEEQWLPKIKEWIATNHKDNEDPTIELSGTELNPYILGELLEKVGYEEDTDSFAQNGWEMDFWLYFFQKPTENFSLCIEGCGITFELKLKKEY